MMPSSELQYSTFEAQLMKILKSHQIDMSIDVARTLTDPNPLLESPPPPKRKKATRKRKKDDGEEPQQ